MSNIYLKVTIEKKWRRYPKFQFPKFKKFVSRLIFGELQLTQISEFLNFLLQLKNQRSGSKTVSGFSTYYCDFGRSYDVGTISK